LDKPHRDFVVRRQSAAATALSELFQYLVAVDVIPRWIIKYWIPPKLPQKNSMAYRSSSVMDRYLVR
jgi:hypothetical protein